MNLLLSLTYHPPTDDQIEVLRSLENYFKCMCAQSPKDWTKWLFLVECWYNASFHSASQITPYEVLYNQLHQPYLQGEPNNVAVDKTT